MGTALLGAWIRPVAGAETDPRFQAEIRPLLQTYCFDCHGERRKKGGVNLEQFQTLGAVEKDLEPWETALRMLKDAEMPPEDKPQPTMEERLALMSWIQETIDHALEVPTDPGRVTLRRLNRTEYNLTMRDLFGVEIRPADRFPAEGGGGGGFDNNADTLFIPPILMERLLAAVQEVLEAAQPERLYLVRPGEGVSEMDAARATLQAQARRAFRRPVRDQELERFLGLYSAEREAGHDWEASVLQMLKAVLMSPHFLYRVEVDREQEGAYRIGAFEMASRLSYFLWSSMPDEELLRLAEEDGLFDEEVLEQQVNRMLEDSKAAAFYEQFTSQWLGVDKLETSAQPDPNRFKEYSVELREAMQREPVELFGHVMRENLSVLELLTADYTFVNGLLAKHYGIEGVDEGAEFGKVALPDRRRGGFLGMGAVLTLTSYPLRTSPVLRGRWILEEVLGTPPPPPPPLVKSLPRDDRPRKGLSFRQRLEQHREDPNCAACHKRMDPLGFALENFDAVGQWRTEIGGQPVDATGEMPGGETFNGPVELREALLGKRDLVLKNLVERMLAYALGRGLEYYDQPTVHQIVKRREANHDAARGLVLDIARSLPFQYRRNDRDLARAGE